MALLELPDDGVDFQSTNMLGQLLSTSEMTAFMTPRWPMPLAPATRLINVLPAVVNNIANTIDGGDKFY